MLDQVKEVPVSVGTVCWTALVVVVEISNGCVHTLNGELAEAKIRRPRDGVMGSQIKQSFLNVSKTGNLAALNTLWYRSDKGVEVLQAFILFSNVSRAKP